MAFKYLTLGWAGQLSTIMATFLFCLWKRRSSCFSHAVKSSDVIQAFLLASYAVGRVLMPLKHRGFFDFPITRSGSFSLPDMFEHHNSNTLFTVLTAVTMYPFKLESFIGEKTEKQPSFICIEDVTETVFRQDGLKA